MTEVLQSAGGVPAATPDAINSAANTAETDASRNRMFVTAVEAVYLIGLFAIAVNVLTTGRATSLGSLPLGVVWFGALGAVLCSFNGVFNHRRDWDPTWTAWHLTRPLIGMSLAIVSWVIFQAGILAVGSTPASATTATQPTNLLYYLIAFVVGYREETFRDLIKKVSDVILTPESTAKTNQTTGGKNGNVERLADPARGGEVTT